MITTVTHNCKHAVTLDVKGPREARQYQNWLGTMPCAACREKQAERDAIVKLIQMGVKELAEGVYTAPSQTEELPHVVLTDSAEHVSYCSCRWFKHDGFKRHNCVHADAVLAFLAERAQSAIAA